MQQVLEFLSFIAGVAVAVAKWIYGTLAELLPAAAWGVLAVVILVLVLHSRLAARIESLETAIDLLSAKLDTVLTQGARSRPRADLQEPKDKGGPTLSGE